MAGHFGVQAAAIALGQQNRQAGPVTLRDADFDSNRADLEVVLERLKDWQAEANGQLLLLLQDEPAFDPAKIRRNGPRI